MGNQFKDTREVMDDSHDPLLQKYSFIVFQKGVSLEKKQKKVIWCCGMSCDLEDLPEYQWMSDDYFILPEL